MEQVLWFGWFRADIISEYALLFWRGLQMTILITLRLHRAGYGAGSGARAGARGRVAAFARQVAGAHAPVSEQGAVAGQFACTKCLDLGGQGSDLRSALLSLTKWLPAQSNRVQEAIFIVATSCHSLFPAADSQVWVGNFTVRANDTSACAADPAAA